MAIDSNDTSRNAVPGPLDARDDSFHEQKRIDAAVRTVGHENAGLKVSLFACGGAGINIATRLLADAQNRVSRSIESFVCYDASVANRVGGYKHVILASGEGGGSMRDENSDEIYRSINNITESDFPIGDVTIVCFSLSGGTGSVAGPLIISEIRRRGGIAIAAVVGDSSSMNTAENTEDTVSTLVNITESGEIYLPTILVSNETESGRSSADLKLIAQMRSLITILTSPTYEIDRNDRRHWLDAAKTTGARPGVKLLYVATNDDHGPKEMSNPSVFLDSVLNVGVRDESGDHHLTAFGRNARFSKQGMFVDYRAHVPMLGMITSDPTALNELVKRCVAVSKRFDTQNFAKVELRNPEDNNRRVDSASGLVMRNRTRR